MEVEDIIRIFNDYISTQRFKNKIQVTGYLVVKKNIEKSNSFTGAYVNYIYTVYYVASDRQIYDLYKCSKNFKADYKEAWNKLSAILLEYLFNLKDSLEWEQILKDEYHGIQ